jgi:site-specific DNA recombinase
MERERAKQRTHDAMLRKAKAGHVVGGKVYGYDNHNVYGDDQGIDGDRKRLHVVRRINEDEARIVRRLFERYASGGYGLRRLAKELNAEQVPPPTKRRHGWAPSAIREILHRELYRGVVTWNKTQAIYRDGTQTSRKRPQEDWLRIEIPELRIIDESLWQRVVARLEQTSGYYMRTFVNGRFLGRPNGADLRSDYLLSGIAQCAVCGGSMICQKRNPKQGRNVYACAYHHDRNTCHNDLRIRQDLMDDVVLRAVSEHLDKHIIAEAIERALPELRSKHAMLPDERHALERQLTGVETRLQHLVNSIATGKATEAVYTALQKRRGHEDNPDGPAGGVGAGG